MQSIIQNSDMREDVKTACFLGVCSSWQDAIIYLAKNTSCE